MTSTSPATHAPAADLPALLADAAGRRSPAHAELAWAALLRLYARRVFAMAAAHVRDHDTAQEITQSVFATIATKLASGQYHEQNRFESWLFRVTMNRVRDEARRRARHARPTDPAALADLRLANPDADSDPAERPDIDRLRAALSQLPDPDRTVIELRHHASLSFQQIADTLDEPLGTVLARHHRALRKLRTLMEHPTA
jgi:RNA polymerase sigma-70 factor (ECF subfamily)